MNNNTINIFDIEKRLKQLEKENNALKSRLNHLEESPIVIDRQWNNINIYEIPPKVWYNPSYAYCSFEKSGKYIVTYLINIIEPNIPVAIGLYDNVPNGVATIVSYNNPVFRTWLHFTTIMNIPADNTMVHPKVFNGSDNPIHLYNMSLYAIKIR